MHTGTQGGRRDARQRTLVVKQRAETKKPPFRSGHFAESGAGNRNRTYDLIITNDALYQLSYSGVLLITLLLAGSVQTNFPAFSVTYVTAPTTYE